MNEILRDHARVSVRLVMTPDRMVIDEARRTFTYLNLYGYLTDAVVVNRIFPPEVGDYFGGWRERQQRALRDVEAAFAPVPVLHARYFGEEVVGPRMLDRLGEALLHGRRPDEVLHDRVGERLELGEEGARLRLELPFASKGEISLKKLGPELIVRVNDAKRTMILPPAMDGLQPAGASFDDGVLHVEFERAAAHG
jgi:arsenite-transporting ATPase